MYSSQQPVLDDREPQAAATSPYSTGATASTTPGHASTPGKPWASPHTPSTFKNPWYQDSKLLSAPGSAASAASTGPAQLPGSTTNTPTRYNHQLPTTYEHDDMSPNVSRHNSIVHPPPRSHAPPPIYFADPTVQLNIEPQRRQSVATVQSNASSGAHHNMAPQHLLQHAHQPQMLHRRAYQPQLKQLPPPRAKRVLHRSELKPTINANPRYRRVSMGSNYLSPLISLTTDLTTTYTLCNPAFNYEVSKNPKRVLTYPCEGKFNNGYDNEANDYILYVNDVLGVEENKRYLVLDILGHGTFAQVVKCQNLKTKELVAVKVIKAIPNHLNQSLTEISILDYINNKIDPLDKHHFLRIKDKFTHKNHLCLVIELLSSNLFELVKQNQYKGLTTKLVRNLAKQLLDSLCVLRDAKIIHCDLKPENILLISPDKPDIKIVDFGAACQERNTLYTYIQSRFYRAPEVVLGLSYSSSIDIWSLGCIIAELFVGLPLFPGTSEYDLLNKISNFFGTPPIWMIEMGKNSKNFFTKDNTTGTYKLKEYDDYIKEKPSLEKPGENYFKTNDLKKLITGYSMNRKNMTTSMIEKELNDRESLVHLLQGLLNINPLERWTPQQAILHPFITETKFSGSWSPPGANLQFDKLQDSVKSSWFS